MPGPSVTERPPTDRLHRRIRLGVREPANWLQLLRFGIVGASGYVLNLTAFAICVGALDADHRVAAVIAFLVAVSNNFALNRHWTFRARGRAVIQAQAVRFLAVSLGAFVLAFLVLELLVTGLGMSELPAQAISVLVAMPANFAGNRLWTFRA